MILSSLQMLVSWTAEGFYKDLLEFTIFLKQKKCLPNIHNQREKKKKKRQDESCHWKKWQRDLCFLTDVTLNINELNLMHQGQ